MISRSFSEIELLAVKLSSKLWPVLILRQIEGKKTILRKAHFKKANVSALSKFNEREGIWACNMRDYQNDTCS